MYCNFSIELKVFFFHNLTSFLLDFNNSNFYSLIELIYTFELDLKLCWKLFFLFCLQNRKCASAILPELSQIMMKNATIPQNSHISYGNIGWQKKLYNLGYKLSKVFPFPVEGLKYVPWVCVRVSSKSMKFQIRYCRIVKSQISNLKLNQTN